MSIIPTPPVKAEDKLARELLLTVILNQMVIMGGLLNPENETVRTEILAQMKHSKRIIEEVEKT